jgi:hypothetical protein
MDTTFTPEQLKQLEVKILDMLTLVRKNIKLLEGPDRTWGEILDKTARDFNIIHNTDIDLDTVYSILNTLNFFDHSTPKIKGKNAV